MTEEVRLGVGTRHIRVIQKLEVPLNKSTSAHGYQAVCCSVFVAAVAERR